MSSASLLISQTPDVLSTLREHVAEDLQLLATIHDAEPGAVLLNELKAQVFPSCLTLLPDTQPGTDAMALMHQALSALPDDPDQVTLDDLAADYASIYLNHNISASPEESVWLDEDSLMCQQSMFQVRSWYESHGLGIPDWRLEQAAMFMDEHLLRWLGNFGERVLARCDTPYFAGAAALTAAYCEALRDILAEVLQQPRPSREEIEERMQPRQQTESVPVAFTPGIGPVV